MLIARAALLLLLAGCATIPELPAGPSEPMERLGALQDTGAGPPATVGNALTLLRNGGDAFAAMFADIAAARDHVNLEYYILENVRAPDGTALFDLLAQKLRQGVAVNLLYDSYGSAGTPEAELAALRALGARTLAYNPVDPLEVRRPFWQPNNRDHRKILVVDGRIAFTGGVNLDRVYERPCVGITEVSQACWRDVAIRLEGPAVADLQRLFLAHWQDQSGAPLPARDWLPGNPPAGPARIRILGSAPDGGQLRYYVTAMAGIRSARNRIWLATGFFVPTHDEREALARAARRGVEVRLLLPRLSDSAAALAAGHAAYDDLLEAGVGIFEVTDAVLHAKLLVVDGVWTAIGSSNFDRRSVALNAEVDAVVLGPATAALLERWLQEGMAGAQPISLAEWRRRSLGERLDELWSRLLIDML